LDSVELARELAGTKCRCGATKYPASTARQTFCGRCYFKLPKEMQQALYRRLGSGYAEAYDAAVKFLAEGEAEWDKLRR
jgi:hypothetical protein